MRGGRHRLRKLLFAAVAVLAVGLGVLGYATNALRSLELNTVDTRFSIRGDEKPRDDLVVVGVDEKTFQNLPGRPRWPFTHDYHARVVDRLRRDGAKVIAPRHPVRRAEQHRQAVVRAARRHRPRRQRRRVDHRGGRPRQRQRLHVLRPARDRRSSKKRRALTDYVEKDLDVVVAYGNFPNDPGGVLRRMTHRHRRAEDLLVAVAEKARGRPIEPGALGGDSAWIDYYGGPRTIRHVSYSDVHEGKTEPGDVPRQDRGGGRNDARACRTCIPPRPRATTRWRAPRSRPTPSPPRCAASRSRTPRPALDVFLIVLLGLVAPVGEPAPLGAPRAGARGRRRRALRDRHAARLQQRDGAVARLPARQRSPWERSAPSPCTT